MDLLSELIHTSVEKAYVPHAMLFFIFDCYYILDWDSPCFFSSLRNRYPTFSGIPYGGRRFGMLCAHPFLFSFFGFTSGTLVWKLSLLILRAASVSCWAFRAFHTRGQ